MISDSDNNVIDKLFTTPKFIIIKHDISDVRVLFVRHPKLILHITGKYIGQISNNYWLSGDYIILPCSLKFMLRTFIK